MLENKICFFLNYFYRSNFTFQESVLLPTESSRPMTTLLFKSTSLRLMKKAVPSQVNTSLTLYPVTLELEVNLTTLWTVWLKTTVCWRTSGLTPVKIVLVEMQWKRNILAWIHRNIKVYNFVYYLFYLYFFSFIFTYIIFNKANIFIINRNTFHFELIEKKFGAQVPLYT